MNYLKKKKSFKISQISQKEFCKFSLCPKDYKELLLVNSNTIKLSEEIKNWYKGIEIGSDNYIKKSPFRFLKTVNVTSSFILGDTSVEHCKPFSGNQPKNNDILIVKDGLGSGLGEVALYKNNTKYKDYISSGIIGIEIKDKKKYYILGILKSQHFKDFININTAQGSTIRHSKLIAFNYLVPFPTTLSHANVNLIEQYISVFTQNVINKEEQIKAKCKLIDRFFENELFSSKKKANNYTYPKKSTLVSCNRLDTIIYSEKYYEYDTAIKSYKNGYFLLKKGNVSPGRTPDDYYFSSTKKSSIFYEWVTPKNINGRKLDYKTYIHTKSNTNVCKNNIILNGIRYVGNGIYIDNEDMVFSNQNTLVIKNFTEASNQLFLYTFLTSKIGKYMQMAQRNLGIVPILYADNLCKIPIPKITDMIKSKIIKEYYNPVKVNSKLTIKNYLEKEKKRNKTAGIHQLNSEVFVLKEKLDYIINKIIKEERIENKYLKFK